jgi:hypothetical protein
MAHVSGDPARAFGDPLALLLNPRLRRCVILQRREDFVAFGLCVLELEAERTRSGQASLWPEFEDFMDAQVEAALGARASAAKKEAAKHEMKAAVSALRSELWSENASIRV